MRITLAITIVTTFALAAWWNYPTLAGSKEAPAVSIDPLYIMTTVTELPAQQFDAY